MNLDLIYGLPYQTPETWKDTLDADRRRSTRTGSPCSASPTSPGRSRTSGCSRRRRCRRPSSASSCSSRRSRRSPAAGYRLIGLDHFALETDELAKAQDGGFLYRNFQGYTIRPAPDTVAFGMTSISDIGGAYAQNSHKLKEWGDKVDAGIIPVERGAAMSDDDVMRRFVINRVMCLLRLDLARGRGEVRARRRARRSRRTSRRA